MKKKNIHTLVLMKFSFLYLFHNKLFTIKKKKKVLMNFILLILIFLFPDICPYSIKVDFYCSLVYMVGDNILPHVSRQSWFLSLSGVYGRRQYFASLQSWFLLLPDIYVFSLYSVNESRSSNIGTYSRNTGDWL